MPLASCQACISLYSTDINLQICRCEQSGVGQCSHWREHHAEIADLCQSALIGCRTCTELWRYFFKEKTPQEYAAEPWFIIGGDTQRPQVATADLTLRLVQQLAGSSSAHVFTNTGIWYRAVDVTRDPVERAAGPKALLNDAESDGATTVALCFGINSPMIHEVEERRFILRNVSQMERIVTLLASGLLQEEEPQRPPSEKRWDMVRRWMSTCETEHQTCSQARRANSGGDPWFPTRLIDVRSRTGDDGHERYLLIETATTRPEGSRYLTLSHVWGSAAEDQQPAYRTLRHNYDDRTNPAVGIRRDELPPCFVDAIDVTQKLGAHYIWIDSLCIVQDNDRDWEAEAGRMSDVYRNSCCSLSATASSSSRDRFPALDERIQEPRFVNTAWGGRYRGMYQIFDPFFWLDRVTSTRLASRGWVFQERALAPRIVHFGHDQVLWECAEFEAAEEFPLGVPRRFISGGRRGFKWQFNLAGSPRSGSGSAETETEPEPQPESAPLQLHAMWSAALDNYTQCELTKATDKLVAISGVARALADQFRDQYHAGLWQSNLVGGLCWRVRGMRRATQELVPVALYAQRWETSRRAAPPAPYLAPSWSWASVDGCVVPGPYLSAGGSGRHESTRSLVAVTAVAVEPETLDNAFGAVKPAAAMRVQGTMYRLVATASKPPFSHISLRYAAGGTGVEAVSVHLDQPEPLEVLGKAWFLPVLLAERCVEAVEAVAEPPAANAVVKEPVKEAVDQPQRPVSESWHAKLKHKGKRLFGCDTSHSSTAAEVEQEPVPLPSIAAAGDPGSEVGKGLAMGLIVVPTDDGKAYRRVGFHESSGRVLETLGRGPGGLCATGEFVLV